MLELVLGIKYRPRPVVRRNTGWYADAKTISEQYPGVDVIPAIMFLDAAGSTGGSFSLTDVKFLSTTKKKKKKKKKHQWNKMKCKHESYRNQ
jgi:hypothetical protein